ncbi:MAG: polysaccharide deacetylase family protein, partial [Candidatus Binatia bacterium]
MTFWNGFSGCVSLTFDDGIKEQLDYAVPELTRRDMRGTFFAITQPETTLGVASVTQKKPFDTHFRRGEWLDAIKHGHELGGHTVTHA